MHRSMYTSIAVLMLVVAAPALGGPWIAANWGSEEPQFPPGSLYYHTNQYPTAPVLFRTVVNVQDGPLDCAVLDARVSGFGYLFVNGRQVAAVAEREDSDGVKTLQADLTPHLRPGPNVLVLSTKDAGFAADGMIAYAGGQPQRIGSSPGDWKVQKVAPLTILEDQAFMRPDFDAGQWYSVRQGEGEAMEATPDALRQTCQELTTQRLRRLDEDAAWRMRILREQGYAVVDWESHGFAGAGRLPGWLIEAAGREPAGGEPGTAYRMAEALARYAVLADEAANLENYATGLQALRVPPSEAQALTRAAQLVGRQLALMETAIRAGRWQEALDAAGAAEAAARDAWAGRLHNDLNRVLENKFGWFDNTELLDSDPAGWGLELSEGATVFANPLSPAALVTVGGRQLTLTGWDEIPTMRRYNRDEPETSGPVTLMAPLGEQVRNLAPGEGGVVYDRQQHGRLAENWVMVVHDMERGGRLPIQIVFLQEPQRVVYESGEKGTRAVTVTFAEDGAQLFLLRPLKEWRGFLQMARDLRADPLSQAVEDRYAGPARLWARAVLHYPMNFSEVFVKDAENPGSLLVADVYDYREFQDAWGTEPMRLAMLPPLATYGLMRDYPGLGPLGEARPLGSLGIWGDLVAVVGQDHVVYRVPIEPITRYGGFTSYCFGPTDIGEPGGRREVETVAATGSNSFRPQHNQTGQRAIDTVQWCIDNGLQNMFNTDEKWVTDVVAHYRTLAEKCKDFPAFGVAYDLLNEPETRDPRAYNALMRKITEAIREHDTTHLIYIETMPPWGPGAAPFPKGAFETLEATGDPLTVYSFHDYEFRLGRVEGMGQAGEARGQARWPNPIADRRAMLSRWIPALRFSIDHRAPIHLGEFGGFEQVRGQNVFENPAAMTMMLDFMDVFDHFGWHWHYYANRGTTRVRLDGSLQESFVQEAVRRYFARGTMNAMREN